MFTLTFFEDTVNEDFIHILNLQVLYHTNLA